MPFKKGQGGRPKGATNLVSKRALEDMFRRIDPSGGQTIWQRIYELAAGSHNDAHARIKAAGLWFAYQHGKPIERQEITGPEGGPIVVHDHFHGVTGPAST